MYQPINIEERRPVWLALSEFYLDTTLDNDAINTIAAQLKLSIYTLDEIKRINREEVFPVLQTNLIGTGGVWTGFNEDWLIKTIAESFNNRSIIKKITNPFYYFLFKNMQKDYWDILEKKFV